MANIKETLLGTCVNGKTVLSDIEVLRRNSTDKIFVGNEATLRVSQLHPKYIELSLNEIIDTNKEAKIFRFTSVNGYLPPFEAGQYINLFVTIDGVTTTRPYSLSSSPKVRAYYEITIARAKGGFVSNYLLDNAKVGDKFQINGPAGVFRYQGVFHKNHSVFLAGGSGITPFLSMSREILESGLNREVTLIYGCRNESVALYDAEFKKYSATYPNFKYYLVSSDPEEGYTGLKGFIDSALIKSLVPDYCDSTFYICGPQIMNEFCQKELFSLGLGVKQVRREMFGSALNIVKEEGYPNGVKATDVFKLKIGDRVIDARADESILVALERAKIRVNVCCRSGECSLCRVKLLKGDVFLAKGMLLRDADKAFNYIHSCKSYPISDIEIRE